MRIISDTSSKSAASPPPAAPAAADLSRIEATLTANAAAREEALFAQLERLTKKIVLEEAAKAPAAGSAESALLAKTYEEKMAALQAGLSGQLGALKEALDERDRRLASLAAELEETRRALGGVKEQVLSLQQAAVAPAARVLPEAPLPAMPETLPPAPAAPVVDAPSLDILSDPPAVSWWTRLRRYFNATVVEIPVHPSDRDSDA
jgi:hypothetical protein